MLVRTVCFPRASACHCPPRFSCVAGPASIQVPFQLHQMHLEPCLIRTPCSYAAMSGQDFRLASAIGEAFQRGCICCYAHLNCTQRMSFGVRSIPQQHLVYCDRHTKSKRSERSTKVDRPTTGGPICATHAYALLSVRLECSFQPSNPP